MSVNRLNGQVVVVTGASSGIGEAVALACAGEGMRVAVAARREEALHNLVGRIEAAGGEALACPTDVRHPEQIEHLVEATIQRFGRIDVMVANAGIGGPAYLHEMSEDHLEDLVITNLLGVVRCARAALPGMIERGSGHIITVSSVAAGLAVSRSSVYAATKAGVHRFCESLRREVRPHGIHVSDILPGVIETPMTAKLPGWPKAPVEGVSRVVVSVIRRPRPWVVTPTWYRLALAANRMAPWFMDRVLAHFEAKERRAREGG